LRDLPAVDGKFLISRLATLPPIAAEAVSRATAVDSTLTVEVEPSTLRVKLRLSS